MFHIFHLLQPDTVFGTIRESSFNMTGGGIRKLFDTLGRGAPNPKNALENFKNEKCSNFVIIKLITTKFQNLLTGTIKTITL